MPPADSFTQYVKTAHQASSTTLPDQSTPDLRRSLALDQLNAKYQRISHPSLPRQQILSHFLDSLTDLQLSSLNEHLTPASRQALLALQINQIARTAQQKDSYSALQNQLENIFETNPTQQHQLLPEYEEMPEISNQEVIHQMTLQELNEMLALTTLDPNLPYYCQLFLLRQRLLFYSAVDTINFKYNLVFSSLAYTAITIIGRLLARRPVSPRLYNWPQLFRLYGVSLSVLSNPASVIKAMSISLSLHMFLWPFSYEQTANTYRFKLNPLFKNEVTARALYNNREFRLLLGRIASRHPELVEADKVLVKKQGDIGIKSGQIDDGAQDLAEALRKQKNEEKSRHPAFKDIQATRSQFIKNMQQMQLYHRYVFQYGGNFKTILNELDGQFKEATGELEGEELKALKQYMRVPQLLDSSGRIKEEEQKSKSKLFSGMNKAVADCQKKELVLRGAKNIEKKVGIQEYLRIREDFNSFDFDRYNIGVMVGPMIFWGGMMLRRVLKL